MSANPPSSVNGPDGVASAAAISQLLGKIYESSPPEQRGSLIECLIRPLGVLGLVAVANGIFAKIRFRGGWPDLHIRMEDAQSVQPNDVVALVDYLQQSGHYAIDGLIQVLSAPSLATTSAAAVALFTLIMQRAKAQRVDE